MISDSILHSYRQIRDLLAGLPAWPVAVVSPEEEEVLTALQKASNDGLVHPLLVGDPDRIHTLMERHCFSFPYELHPAADHAAAAELAVALVRRGTAAGLMKGVLSTAVFLRAVLDRAKGLRTERLLSHITLFEVPAYDRMLIVTDAAVNIAPDIEGKRRILEHAAAAARALGISVPAAAVLCAVEKVQESMPATIHAAALRELARTGELGQLLVSGPLSLDLALSSEAARIKGVDDPVAGRADILLVPEIETGNVLVKSLHYLAELPHGGAVMGATVPIVLTSRSDSADSRYNSLLLAALVAKRGRYA